MQTPDEQLGPRARNRRAVEAEILRVARAHLATSGPDGLSLRAVARDLGMVSSGIYRYVESRDELLTRLIVDGYTSLAEHVTAAHDAVDPTDLDGRWDAIGRSLRTWALEHPHDFALLYGSPVPGYAAPAERTTGPGTAVLALLTRLLDEIVRSGRRPSVDPSSVPEAEKGVASMLAQDFFDGTAIDAVALARGLSAWTLLIGAVTSELFSQLGEIEDPESLFEWHLTCARGLALAPSPAARATRTTS